MPEERRRLLAPHRREAPQQEPDRQAAAVAEEDRRRIEVVAKEREQRPHERRRGQRERSVALKERRGQGGKGGEQADAGGQPVHSVDQVERIRAHDEPADGDREAPPAMRGDAADGRHFHAGPIRESCRDDLADHLLPGAEPDDVVDEADEEDGGRRGNQRDCERQVHRRPAVQRRVHEQHEGKDISEGNRDTARPRRRLLVELAPGFGESTSPVRCDQRLTSGVSTRQATNETTPRKMMEYIAESQMGPSRFAVRKATEYAICAGLRRLPVWAARAPAAMRPARTLRISRWNHPRHQVLLD